jgi:protein involved in polysaccharide export with SLBB domain
MRDRLLIYLAGLLLAAQMAVAADAPTNTTTTAAPPPTAKRAPWQERFTLGPGDVLNFSLFDTNQTSRTDLSIGPDGRLSFLEAEHVLATGLTIDELRAKFDSELGKYYKNPHTIITPVEYRSKRYVIMGAVMNSGVYPMDRPITVIEAVARAGGIETGVYQAGAVELVDLGRCFLSRRGERVAVDFERLFQRGDIAQNVPLEPNDYLYLGLVSANEIYVLGEVGSPGVLSFGTKPTVISAIASRGGFTGKAYKSRVLVVRGSLNNPQTFVVDTAAILAGKAPDFKLEQKDIVYVGVSPWLKAAEVLDVAAQAFLRAMTVQYTSDNIGPIITSPWIQ